MADTPVPGFRRRELLPVDDPALDFAMSLLAFDAGVGLPNIEIHDEEHGLYMTAGGGDYHLDGDTHEVERGDFIYMAPYCAQGFTARAASRRSTCSTRTPGATGSRDLPHHHPARVGGGGA